MSAVLELPVIRVLLGLAPDRALVVLVTEDGGVENRLFAPPAGSPLAPRVPPALEFDVLL